jgi:hypothetical protein
MPEDIITAKYAFTNAFVTRRIADYNLCKKEKINGIRD